MFVRDLKSGTTEQVSVASDGAQANGGSFGPAISADGRYVAFYSGASNLVPGDTNRREMCSCATSVGHHRARQRGQQRHARPTAKALPGD